MVGRIIALLFHDRGTRRGWVVSSTPRPHFTPGKDPVPILQEAGWAPGPVWTGGISRPHRDSIPDRPARSQSLYRLSYPTHSTYVSTIKKSEDRVETLKFLVITTCPTSMSNTDSWLSKCFKPANNKELWVAGNAFDLFSLGIITNKTCRRLRHNLYMATSHLTRYY